MSVPRLYLQDSPPLRVRDIEVRIDGITPTRGRCGKPTCHCHQPGDSGHGANLRLTYKLHGKSVTESLPDQAAVRKAESEIAEFRKLEELHKRFVAVNGEICRLRPVEETITPQKNNGRGGLPGSGARNRPSAACGF